MLSKANKNAESLPLGNTIMKIYPRVCVKQTNKDSEQNHLLEKIYIKF